MTDRTREFFIDGHWTAPLGTDRFTLIDPATEQPYGELAMGTAADVDRAVEAAVRAFPSFSNTSVADRCALLERILRAYERRAEEFAQAVSQEIGAPIALARTQQVPHVSATLHEMIRVLKSYRFEERSDGMTVLREPIGVCGLITPWNWPIHLIMAKLVPALGAGCTMVLKPSEYSPLDALLLAEVMDEAGVPAGVFNLVNGDGPTVGAALSRHPDIAMISFTGSTRAGVQIAKDAADTVKRVAQEMGGKSANIILPDADLQAAVATGVAFCFNNSGQACNAPTRMLVPADRHEEALEYARIAAEAMTVGDPHDAVTVLGPVANKLQFDKVQALIETGIGEGATLVTGGPGRPDYLDRGYYVRPTVFGGVRNDMRVAREEIFGPVLVVIPYEDEAQAISIANDTVYGLAAFVQTNDEAAGRRIAAQLRAGNVMMNYAFPRATMPFGGYKQSGNGREFSVYGLEEFLEIKAIVSPAA